MASVALGFPFKADQNAAPPKTEPPVCTDCESKALALAQRIENQLPCEPTLTAIGIVNKLFIKHRRGKNALEF